MKRGGLLIVKVLPSFLLLFVMFRLWQKIQQPDVFFKVLHSLFLVVFACWTAWAAAGVVSKAPAGGGQASRSEAKALLLVSFFLLAAFMLVADSRFLQKASIPSALPLPWLTIQGHFSGAAASGLACCLLFWITYLFLRKLTPGHDPWLFPLTAMLSGVGLVFLYRLGPDIAEIRGAAGFRNLFMLQLRSLSLSLLTLIAAVFYFSDRQLEALTRKRYVYVLAAILLITITAVFGTEIHGRRLAVNLGVMNFQTVELVKLLALLFMVGYFRYEVHFLESQKGRFNLPRARFWMPYLTMWVLTLLPIFFQRDLGPTALIFALFLVVFYLGTGSAFSVWAGLILMAGIGAASYYAGWPSMVKTRIDMWLEPFRYSQNLAEALWAVGDGGIFGTGIAMGLGYHIPVVQSDFNFAAIAEEWGALGVLSILAIYGLLVWRTLKIAFGAGSPYKQLLAAGIATLWLIQAFIIVGGNLGLLPLTGITLPFISFGGSSLLINFLALGIVLRISAAPK